MTIQHFVLISSLVLMAGCAAKPEPAKVQAASTSSPMEIVPNANLRTLIQEGNPAMKPVSATIQAAGRVAADETRLARVSAPVTGRIVELDAVEGQRVRKGQVIARIFSTELSSAQSAYLKAASQQQAAERAVQRAKMLLEADVIGSAELQRRESELYQAGTDLAAAHEQLRVLGISEESLRKLQADRKLSSVSDVHATIDGIVMERHATMGQLVQAVETVFVVADLSSVWMVADVPEQEADGLAIGKEVRAEIPALPNDRISGRISFVSAIVNPETRTVRVRMNLANPQGRYKPSMLANMTVVDGSQQRLVVPAGAVVRENNKDYVFVKKSADAFVLRPVELGDDSGDFRVVLEGLKTTDTIITDGAFHVNNERRRQQHGSDSGD